MSKEIEIKMPKLGDKMESGVICAWLKKEGEEVEEGECLFEVETDKVVNEVEAVEAGILKKILFEEGEEVAVLETVGILTV